MYLNVHSDYSLRYGTLSLDDIIAFAVDNRIEVLALTDINNTTGSMDFVQTCVKVGIKPVLGIEFRKEHKLLYIGLAANREGFKELNDFLTWHNLNNVPLPDRPWAFQNAFVIYPWGRDIQLLENEYLGIRYTELNQLFGKPLNRVREKLVALHPVTFFDNGYDHHRYLRAIDKNTLLTKLTVEDVAPRTEVMVAPDQLRRLYAAYPFVIENTVSLLERCTFTCDLKSSRNRKIFTGSFIDDRLLLEKLALDGMKYRYGSSNREALNRVRKELAVIEELGFCSYFLITWDIIRYSMSRGFYHVGRGSGANSIVAYCLRITDVDPIELDLYFERFLNAKRTSPPDFDIDYSWDERDEVLEYVFKRYGSNYTALLGTMSTFKRRSIIRELGKVVGLPKSEIDLLVSTDALTRENNDLIRQILTIGKLMDEKPNQRSIHAGGVLISEEPITYFTALDLPPKGLPTVQWDMYTAEAIGFEKFDILSQRGIGHIREAAQIIRENRKISVDIHAVQDFKKDQKVAEQLKSGDTVGCFYIESPGMRGLLKKLKCDTYLTLVAASSIIRPGVSKSGMMREYISRFHKQDDIKFLHPVMKEQLQETYGVMVYQEDVIKVCHHYAGLDLTDADILRRAMSGKFRSRTEFEKLVQRFFEKAKELGRPEEITKEVWRQVESFAGYSFSKAHSASFAVESYQSLYLKSHFPREFMVAVLNNYGGFYAGARWVYLNEAKQAGATINLPCVNHSGERATIDGTDIWIGMADVHGLEGKVITDILNERFRNGVYKDLEDFVHRSNISLEQAIILIRVGAIRFTGKGKKDLLWEVHNYLGNESVCSEDRELFYVKAKEYKLPVLVHNPEEDAFDELELLGYPVTLSFFDLLKTDCRGDVMAHELKDRVGDVVKMLGCFVCQKTVYTVKKQNMYFGTFLDSEGRFFDTTHFPDSAQRYPFKGAGCYLILGKVVEEFGFPSVEVHKFAKLPIISDPYLV